MFDPDSVKTYKLFHGDARDVLRSFKPGSVHSILSMAAVVVGSDESAEENAVLHELYYDVLDDSGSLFTHGSNVDMEGIGWIRQHDTFSSHYTKSDDFYREFDDSPVRNVEDYAKAGKIMNVEVSGMDLAYDVLCNFYTPPGGITMDPTMGDDPHLIAALQRGRRAIGIERVDSWYDRAARRMALYGNGITVK